MSKAEWIIRDNQTGKWLGADGSWYHSYEFFQIKIYTHRGSNRWLNNRIDCDCTAMLLEVAAKKYGMWITSHP